MDFKLANAFLPTKETEDPERFAGRRDELATVAYALASNGAHLVIYGERGVGKSSLARQIQHLAGGQ